jgi:type IV pilus assembly protein PilQ
VNIVTTPEVIGNVTIRLIDVPWEKALDAILKTHGFGYDKQGNIIMVAPIDKLTAQKKQEVELAQVQPTVTEVFNLKYIDAQDAKKALEPQLSARGKITVLEMTGQAGWEFGGAELGKRKREAEEKKARSKILIISDIPPVLDKIKEVIAQLDVMPQQILIEARIMEVSRDKLKDIGFDWGTGTSGAESSTIYMTPAGKRSGADTSQVGGHLLGDQITPSVFGPKESTTLTTANTGLRVLFKKLTGAQFEVLIHALEEDVNTNTLSAPRIMTMNNQEATILVGTRYPILKTDTTGAGSTAITNVLM